MQQPPLAQLLMQYLQPQATPASSQTLQYMIQDGLYPPGRFYPDGQRPQPEESLEDLLRRRFMTPNTDPGPMLPRDLAPNFVIPHLPGKMS
jgi:hypothetical protein